ncbi:MAG: hypothetical protein QM817_36920 [Archangium sp.]
MFFALALVLAQSPACDTPTWCLQEAEAAERADNAAAAKEFRQRAKALSALLQAQERARAAKNPNPTVPPMVTAPEVIEPQSAVEPPVPTPEDTTPAPAESVEEEKPVAEVQAAAIDPGPPTRAGFAVTGGLEVGPQLQSQTWQARGRVGIGARVSLLERNPTGELETLPTVAFLAGYAGRLVDATDHRVFGEGRFELLVSRPRGMLGPVFTAYLLSGVDLLVGGPALGAQPYFGAGVGWDGNPFNGKPGAKASLGNGLGQFASGLFRGIGGGGGIGAAAAIALVPVIIVGAAVVAVAIVTYICAGRFEVRYHPWSSRSAQPTVSMLIGYGF